MPLSKPVGRLRHRFGEQSENASNDQETVIRLLNLIPYAEAGAQGSLSGPIVEGYASRSLYDAIIDFEDRHFPVQGEGVVKPGSAILKRLEELAARNANAPWAKTMPALTRLAPPKIVPIHGVLTATFQCDLAWVVGYNARIRPMVAAANLATLTLNAAYSAVPDGKGKYTVAAWAPMGWWRWAPVAGVPRTVKPELEDALSVPERWLKPQEGYFRWTGADLSAWVDLVLTYQGAAPLATLRRVLNRREIILHEERYRAWSKNPQLYRQIYDETDAPEFEYPARPEGSGEFADVGKEEVQGFVWSFQGFK